MSLRDFLGTSLEDYCSSTDLRTWQTNSCYLHITLILPRGRSCKPLECGLLLLFGFWGFFVFFFFTILAELSSQIIIFTGPCNSAYYLNVFQTGNWQVVCPLHGNSVLLRCYHTDLPLKIYCCIPVYTEHNHGEKNEVMHIIKVETKCISLAKFNCIRLVFYQN